MARRRTVVLFLGAALAALSILGWLGVSGSAGRLTAEVWPNAAPLDQPVTDPGTVPTDNPAVTTGPSLSCAAVGSGTDTGATQPVDPSLSTGDPSALGNPPTGCPSDAGPNGYQRGEIWPNGAPGEIWPNGTPGMVPSGF